MIQDRYLLNETEDQFFIDHADVIFDLLAVLGAGGIIGLVSGLCFHITWIIWGSVAILGLFGGSASLTLYLGHQHQQRKFDARIKCNSQ